MGQMRFTIPRPERISPFVLQRTYVAGMDSIPWVSTTEWDGSVLTVAREIRESGNLNIPWWVDGVGEVMLITASLMERRSPYLLPLELARGTLNRLRNQVAQWEQAGMNISAEVRSQMQAASHIFAHAATRQGNALDSGDDAEESIRLALSSIQLLATDYARQVLAVRRHQSSQLPTLLAGNLGTRILSDRPARRFLRAFNSAVVPIPWKEVEPDQSRFDLSAVVNQIRWCRDKGLRVIGGPLVTLSRASLPDWMYLWEGDFEMVQPCVQSFLQKSVEPLVGSVHVWNVAARLNVPDALRLTEENRLRLTVDSIETVKRLDPKVPIIVTFDQPFAEFLAAEELELSPIHFADTLVRAELGISGLGLELNFDYWPHGSTRRDLLEVNRLLDLWGSLGLPLVVFVTAPSSDDGDPQAPVGIKTVAIAEPTGHSRESQDRFVAGLVPLLLSKPIVHAIVWNQLCDDVTHEFPYGGLFDFRQKKKKAIRTLGALRRTYLA